MLSTTVVFASVIILLLFAYDKFSKPRNYPPGPFVFPIVGVFPHFFRKGFLEKVAEWKEQFGPIVSLAFGSNRVIILHDLNLIKEAYTMDAFLGRPTAAPVRLIATDKKRGLVASEGVQWEAQRRFALRNLRDFGFGKRSNEQETQEDIVDLLTQFRKDLGQPISTSKKFNLSVVSSLWNIITGRRYNIDDPEFQNVLQKINIVISTAASNIPAFTMDWLIALAPYLTGWTQFKNAVNGTKDFIKEQIEYHKATYEPGEPRDYIDVYLNEMKQTVDENSSFFKDAGEENLLVGTLNLLAAGAETTSSTLSWALLFISRNPTVQAKLQAEIDRVVGRSRLPSLADQETMPYTSATILEIMRKSSLTALGVPHCTMTDVEFHGYNIPKNTIVFANFYEVHHNEEVWGDPEAFRPERFLTPDGKLDKGHPPVVPFSVGRRQCLGETLARNNIFLFLVSLFQAFDINAPDLTGESEGIKEPTGFIRFPPEFKVVFEERG